jgi:hypothetical protein
MMSVILNYAYVQAHATLAELAAAPIAMTIAAAWFTLDRNYRKQLQLTPAITDRWDQKIGSVIASDHIEKQYYSGCST